MSTKGYGCRVKWLSDAEFRAWIGYRRMRLLLDAQIARDLARDSALSSADYDVLSTLSEEDGRRFRLSALAARMLWSKSRLSRHISRMEERGLVVREDSPDDGRGAEIVLTAAGMRAIEAAAPDHVASVRKHFIDLLTPNELRMLAKVAEKVLAALPEGGDDLGHAG
jgi:DNA-binding MarR family transcriptional regulator